MKAYGGASYISYGVSVDPSIRTKQSHPYNYGPITLYSNAAVEPNGTVYTDRLLQWDFSKYNALCERHFGDQGQVWERRSPKQIAAFLRDWYEDPELQLVAVIEYCNQASGYPTWRLDYRATPRTNQ